MPFALSQDCRIYYRLEGSAAKPLLVLVHALGTDHGIWDLQLPPLLPHFQVLRLDLRGHGASDAPAGEYSLDQLADDVLKVVETTGRTRFCYCGLSLGGMIGQWLATHSASHIEKLVLANTSPRMPDPSLFEARRHTALQEGMASIAEAAIGRFFTAGMLASGNPLIETIRTLVRSTNPVGYAGCCSAIRDMDQRSQLSSIQLPTLVIGGEEDVSTPWAGHGDLLVQQIQDARSVLLPVAHLSNVEQPTAFSAALLDFLTEP